MQRNLEKTKGELDGVQSRVVNQTGEAVVVRGGLVAVGNRLEGNTRALEEANNRLRLAQNTLAEARQNVTTATDSISQIQQ